jgi:hypothetical protein
MIDFMVLAAPRSGTTWAANWLTTDFTTCLHDPLFTHHYDALDSIPSTKVLGLSCTALWMWPTWVNAHPARKVILHRPMEEVNASLEELGLPPMALDTEARLFEIEGMHVPYTDLFEKPTRMYEFLTGRPFDQERHTQLLDMHIQPKFSSIKLDVRSAQRLMRELSELVPQKG